MDDLVQFLRDRYDEESSEAELAATETGADWQYDSESGYVMGSRDHGMVATGSQDFLESAAGAHIARHDPARVLREVEAKRELLADYERFVAERRRMMGGWDSYPEPSSVLLAFAAVYSDHPDYRDDWRP
ncbi:DUF6221 family protein [Streptomyces badius]